MLLSTPWLKVYWPVRAVTLDGQQMDDVTKEFSKVTPWPASSSWTRGMYCIVATSWSSVMMNTMFGWAAGRTHGPGPSAFRVSRRRDDAAAGGGRIASTSSMHETIAWQISWNRCGGLRYNGETSLPARKPSAGAVPGR